MNYISSNFEICNGIGDLACLHQDVLYSIFHQISLGEIDIIRKIFCQTVECLDLMKSVSEFAWSMEACLLTPRFADPLVNRVELTPTKGKAFWRKSGTYTVLVLPPLSNGLGRTSKLNNWKCELKLIKLKTSTKSPFSYSDSTNKLERFGIVDSPWKEQIQQDYHTTGLSGYHGTLAYVKNGDLKQGNDEKGQTPKNQKWKAGDALGIEVCMSDKKEERIALFFVNGKEQSYCYRGIPQQIQFGFTAFAAESSVELLFVKNLKEGKDHMKNIPSVLEWKYDYD